MILEALAAFNQWWFDVIVKNGGYIFLILMAVAIPLQINTWRMRKRSERLWRELNNRWAKSIGDEWNTV